MLVVATLAGPARRMTARRSRVNWPACSCKAACSSPATARAARLGQADRAAGTAAGSAQQAFLMALPGVVFDATDTIGKLVVMSADGGSCSVVAESADGAAVIERPGTGSAAQAQIAFSLSRDERRSPRRSRCITANTSLPRPSASGRSWSAPSATGRRHGDADGQRRLRRLVKARATRYRLPVLRRRHPQMGRALRGLRRVEHHRRGSGRSASRPRRQGGRGRRIAVRRPGRRGRAAAAHRHRDRRTGPRAGRRAGAGLGGAGRRRPGHRQVHAAAAGRRARWPAPASGCCTSRARKSVEQVRLRARRLGVGGRASSNWPRPINLRDIAASLEQAQRRRAGGDRLDPDHVAGQRSTARRAPCRRCAPAASS